VIKTTSAPVARSALLARAQRISQGERAPAVLSEPATERSPMRMLRLSQVVEKTGLGKTSIYELQKEGRFPRGVNLTGHSVRWIEAEVETWLTRQAQARIPTP
jgi:prophage regulatory protein